MGQFVDGPATTGAVVLVAAGECSAVKIAGGVEGWTGGRLAAVLAAREVVNDGVGLRLRRIGKAGNKEKCSHEREDQTGRAPGRSETASVMLHYETSF